MSTLAQTYAAAARSRATVVLQGVHAVKHALRFGADVRDLVTPDLPTLLRLVDEVAPDLRERIERAVTVVPIEVFAGLTRRPPASPLLGVAPVPEGRPEPGSGRSIVLFEPRHAGNTGAVIRVAAAAGASGVYVTGEMDVWSEPVVRAAAGLHWAVDVASVDWPLPGDRPTIAFDPDTGDTDFTSLPADCALVFGGERHGLPAHVLEGVDRVVRIPMRAGVSSLNLATSVAVALYAARD